MTTPSKLQFYTPEKCVKENVKPCSRPSCPSHFNSYQTPTKQSPFHKTPSKQSPAYVTPSKSISKTFLHHTPRQPLGAINNNNDTFPSEMKLPDRLEQPKTPKKPPSLTPARHFITQTPCGMGKNRTPLKVSTTSMSTTKKRHGRMSRLEAEVMQLNLGSDIYDGAQRGSMIVMSNCKSKKSLKEALGSDRFVSPVRHSARLAAASSQNQPTSAVLEQSGYSYVPNPSLTNTYFDDRKSKKKTPQNNNTPKKLIF